MGTVVGGVIITFDISVFAVIKIELNKKVTIMNFPLSLYGCHSIKSDLFIYGNLFVYNDLSVRNVTVNEISNSFGPMTINDLYVADGINVTKTKVLPIYPLNIDDSLQFTPEGQLSVVPKILLQSDLEMKTQAPIKLILDSDTDPDDPIGSTLLLIMMRIDLPLVIQGNFLSSSQMMMST